MCSYDVTSLFTQIPLHETINICLDKIFSNSTITFHGFNRTQFKSLLELATCNSYFTFNNNLYKQIDGVAMGSPIGPTMANLFLSHWEQIWLNICPENCKPSLFRRYVDDTFVLFDEPTKATNFLNFLNNQHDNIKFTIEQEQNRTLPFLDTSISINNNKFESSIYRKPTFTGLGTHFLSFTQKIYKINSIKTLIYRSFHLSSTYLNFHNDITFLKKFFIDNGYPSNLFHNILKTFLNKTYIQEPAVQTVSKCKIFIPMPYFGYISDKIKNELQPLLTKLYPHLSIKLVFKNTYSIGSLFKIKDRLPESLCSSIIYSYRCVDCSSTYIGSSIRQFHCRTHEHRNLSVRTGLPLASERFSSIMEHSKEKGHRINNNSFEIISRCHNNFDIRYLEALYILKRKPNLNSGLPVELSIVQF